jgi:hypothetical protein
LAQGGGEMTSPDTKAREILDGWGFVEAHPHYPILRDKIAAALVEHGEKCVRKAVIESFGPEYRKIDAEGYLRGRVDEAKECDAHAKREYRRGIGKILGQISQLEKQCWPIECEDLFKAIRILAQKTGGEK